ncbi:putative lipoprotein LppJ [Mycobacterium saskatchewanense]|uniref:hypothetical protein n=1 Tax=Mycobacterium saskatchewanense TaxID=220927 RepID=UPI00138D3198|nr:hypothetical protein [Mycobacterium saskatchewanense]BBX64750.1 putative lipoprotein LppJ [Mycobacterium saskatchewanense]
MWTFLARTAFFASIIGLIVSGCSETVSHPLSPMQARAQVLDASRDVVRALHAEVTEANFSFESCNDQGEAPFRGVVDLSFWMPNVPHDQPADPQAVVRGLVADGWSTDSEFVSHGQTLKKNGVNIILTVAPQPPPSITLIRHVGVKVDGECRDTSDHRTDGSTGPVDVRKDIG